MKQTEFNLGDKVIVNMFAKPTIAFIEAPDKQHENKYVIQGKDGHKYYYCRYENNTESKEKGNYIADVHINLYMNENKINVKKLIKEEVDRMKYKVHYSLGAITVCRTALEEEGYTITGKPSFLDGKSGIEIGFSSNDGKKYKLIVEEV